MAESGPLYLPMLTIMAFVMILGAALLILIWLVSKRTPNRFLRTAAPVAVMLLGIIWLKDTDAGDIVAASWSPCREDPFLKKSAHGRE